MSGARSFLWPIAVMALLTAVSSIPGTGPHDDTLKSTSLLDWLSPEVQNLLHLPAFAALGWAWFRALVRYFRPSGAVAAGFALTLAFAIADEWHQAAVPGRSSSATDVAADALGAALAAAVYMWRCRRATS